MTGILAQPARRVEEVSEVRTMKPFKKFGPMFAVVCLLSLFAGFAHAAAAAQSKEEKAQQEEAAKKAAEAKAKFAAMKGHFDAGTMALEQAKGIRAQMDKLPKDQQASMQGQLDMASQTAITEFQAALEGTAETDSNRPLVLAKLGESYETDAKYGDAADAYQKAVAIKPDPAYYNNLGNSLARVGKTDEATAAYQQAIQLDPMNTAMYWRNLAVGLYNTGKDQRVS